MHCEKGAYILEVRSLIKGQIWNLNIPSLSILLGITTLCDLVTEIGLWLLWRATCDHFIWNILTCESLGIFFWNTSDPDPCAGLLTSVCLTTSCWSYGNIIMRNFMQKMDQIWIHDWYFILLFMNIDLKRNLWQLFSFRDIY